MTSQTQPSSQTSRPQGYLKEEFRFFHLKDLGKGPYEYHHHDFLKILILINGNVSYSIEGRSYRLMPWDMVLVDRGQIHRPEPDPSCPYERLILYLSPAFLEAHKHADSDPYASAQPATATLRFCGLQKKSSALWLSF